MLLLLFALLAASAAAPIVIYKLGRPAFALLALVPAAGFVWITQQFMAGTFAHGGVLTFALEWMPAAHLNIVLRLDSLAALFSLIILGMGALILLYCWGYFDKAPPRLALFGGEMMGFAAAMYGLVIADNLLLMYMAWEITSLLSFLLVSYYGERASARRSAIQALMVTVLGGLAMLVGIISFGRQTGVWTFSEIASFTAAAGQPITSTPFITISIVFILAGALSKSAIAPAHFWLPGAMAAPTPVSAYLHSAAMVKAGIYLIARLAPDLRFVESWYLVIIPLGIFTMLLGGWMALKQRDLKLILAYGTVSQLGFIIAVMSIGSREALQAGLALTFAHALFKAALFMVVGAIDHVTGTRDITKLSGLMTKEPLLCAAAVISALSMAGFPPLLGFVAKEAVIETVLHEDLLVGMPRQMLLVGVVLGSVLTMAYALRFLWGAFGRKQGQTSEAVSSAQKAGPLLWLPPAALTLLTIFFGVHPKPLSVVFNQHLDNVMVRLPVSAEPTHLALWHGLNLPLGISALIVVGGVVMFWQRDLVAKAQFDTPALGSANDAYDQVLIGLRKASLKITASTQRGSLQYNLTTIFCCLIVVVGASLISGDLNDVRMIVADNLWQAVAAVTIIVSAIATINMHNRLSAVLMAGVSGYGISFIFALHGAPDLALTQLLVETIVVVLFMLVLRKMPSNTEWRQDPKMNRLRAWLSVAVGVTVSVVGLFALNARTATPISSFMPELAEEIGHGANTVNVLLVDMRAWDTFGEVTVLVAAATGVASLIYGSKSFTRPSRRPTLRTKGRRWLATSGHSERSQNRSLLVDVITRVLFPSMLVLSMYFFFAGHNAPGGGFAGGLVAGLALTLRYLAGGREELEETLPIDASRLLGSGLLLAAVSVIVPLFFGHPPLTSFYTALELPLLGHVSLPSALVFDAGVYLIVVGVITLILSSAGAKLDEEEDARKQRARERAAKAAHHARSRTKKARA
ncbi:monovalent cation/H+ antiporter subunit A [Corynebacterium phocae]|uniref:Monovalent cation/H+ antiporter subunit A n=1 Tax=Corynebacterium phocae TaxID=161895 RepID=A0A1L7D584_9CORY|nr:Na+/H+ antiporter subunit A [Corynebacterium phocae]APT93299.1 monovalent cation/H+ antiporter subunit A [Corynebacterium phocae]KAA8721628.1 Na+/H+ antiporter subunit A [Corynebacterium phocae]